VPNISTLNFSIILDAINLDDPTPEPQTTITLAFLLFFCLYLAIAAA